MSACLVDVVLACERIGRFVDDRSFEEYSEDELLQSGVERQLEVIGEALNRARRIDADIAERIPHTVRIIGLRNILAHGYDSVSAELVWDIATASVPKLLADVGELLAD